jgi:hypothetical protein
MHFDRLQLSVVRTSLGRWSFRNIKVSVDAETESLMENQLGLSFVPIFHCTPWTGNSPSLFQVVGRAL